MQLDSGAGADAGKSAEELREERRAKREERLAERRARIASERQPERPDPRDEEIIDDEDDEELDDEELIDEPPELLVDPSVLRRPDQDLLPAAPGGAAVPFPIDAVPGEVPQFE